MMYIHASVVASYVYVYILYLQKISDTLDKNSLAVKTVRGQLEASLQHLKAKKKLLSFLLQK